MSLKQKAAHLAHTNEMLAERVEQMLELDEPPIKVIDAALEDLQSYKAADLEKVKEESSCGGERLIEKLGKLYPQDWERRGSHPEFHNYNMQMTVEHLLLHEAHQLYGMEQLRAAPEIDGTSAECYLRWYSLIVGSRSSRGRFPD